MHEHDNDRPSCGPSGPASPYPQDVANVLSHLANLIDSSIAVRGVGAGPRVFVARHFGCDPFDLLVTSRTLGSLQFQLTGLAFADLVRAHRPAGVIGEDMDEAPRWESVPLGETNASIPFELTAVFPPCSVATCSIGVTFDSARYREKPTIRVWSTPCDAGRAVRWLDELIDASRSAHAFRGRVVRATTKEDTGLWFEVESLPPAHRSDVVLRPDVWREIDRSITALFVRREVLERAGLSSNRGLLLAGPPGTGKTAVCRAIASELAGDVTVVFCDGGVVQREVKALYRELTYLAPALVVMEDLDLVIGNRKGGSSGSLNDFLLALDGAMSTHTGVVTLATTNDVSGIDEAARRAGRFDAIVRVDMPDACARAAIIRSFLSGLDADVDVDVVANVTNEWTGAELRELVTRAVLDAETVRTEDLLRLVREECAREGPGAYL